jgi:hypothetical protein
MCRSWQKRALEDGRKPGCNPAKQYFLSTNYRRFFPTMLAAMQWVEEVIAAEQK